MTKDGHLPVIDPRIVGPPPERHAARVVGEMVRWLAGERARLSAELLAVLLNSRSRFGSPVAQRRLADRLRRAGGKAILDLRLRPGKRGNFILAIVEWFVYDASRNEAISPTDSIPEKPWLACEATVWPYKKHDGQFTVTARTPFDLLDAVDKLWRALEKQINWDECVSKALDGAKNIPMKKPKYVSVAGGKAAFEWDKTRGSSGSLVVTTILDENMKV